MERLINALRAQAGGIDQTLAQPRFATVASFNSANFTARVLLQPEGVLSGWLPVLSALTGQGWGMICPLAAGDQVFVLAQEGHAEHGVVVGRVYSNLSPPPQAPDGEVWLRHRSGACLRLQDNGKIVIEGDLSVTGDVSDHHGSLNHLRGVFDSHVHTNSGGVPTSVPSVMD